MLFELNISIPSPSYGLRLRSVGAHTSDRLEALPNVKRRIDMIDVPSEDSSVVEIQHGVGTRDLVDLTSLDYGKDQAKSYRTPPITLRKPFGRNGFEKTVPEKQHHLLWFSHWFLRRLQI